MSNFIPDSVLQQVKARIEILDIISEYVTLSDKKGKDEHIGLCPFHNEKSPSFSVNPRKGLFFCFGCGEKGDAISFLMNLNHQSFTETILDLAERYGVTVATDDESVALWQAKTKLKRQLIELNEVVCKFLISCHDRHSLKYLSQRSLSPATISKFRLGYAPDSWQALPEFLARRYQPELITASGLVGCKNGRNYSLFRHRIMMPLFNPQGEVIGFSGRTLGTDNPKYLNSPQTAVFSKNEVLYPLHLAKESIVKRDSAIIVEGNFDVIRLHQAGITNAIASLGTSLSQKQVNTLINLTPSNRLILALDNDLPGDKAARRIVADNLKTISQKLIEVKIVQLPKEIKDVDQLLEVEQGDRLLNKLISQADSWLDWEIAKLGSRYRINDPNQTPEDFNLCSQGFTKLLVQIEDLNLKTFYLNRCAKILAKGNPELTSKHLKALAFKTRRPLVKTAKENGRKKTSGSETTDLDSLVTSLSPLDTKILSCETKLTKIALFYPAYRQEIITQVSTVLEWFVQDKTCRWLLNHLSSQQKNSTLGDSNDYENIVLKNQLLNLINQEDVFNNTPEFLNLNWKQDRFLIEARIIKIFSQSESELLSITNTQEIIKQSLRGIKQVQLNQNISCLQTLITTTKDIQEQRHYITEIMNFKKQLTLL